MLKTGLLNPWTVLRWGAVSSVPATLWAATVFALYA